MISTAIGLERKSRVSGYKIKKGNFDNETPNLKHVIVVLGEANTANQGTLSTVKKEITSAQQAAELYGWGSPLHQQFRILRPISGDGVGGIPTIAMPQDSDGGATATVHEWTVAGNATSNGTHTFVINGRSSVDFQSYSFAVVKDETPTQIAAKIADAINSVLASPVTAAAALGVVTLTTKWAGVSSTSLDTSVDVGSNDAGVTYTQTDSTAGAGAVDLAGALAQFGEEWITIVLNPYAATDATTLQALEDFNGVPDDENPTGRYVGRVFKPFVSLFGSTLNDVASLTAITDAAARKGQVTNSLCPAPFSKGWPFEASANVCAVFARISQDTPQLDVNAKSYPDMPVPVDGIIGDMSDYNNRDLLVKKGCSTVILENGKYQIQDLVTTYHPDGELVLQFDYLRNLIIDWNVKDGYTILEGIHVKDHVIVNDGQVTESTKSVKPKQWAAVLYDFFDELAVEGLITEPEFSKDSLQIERNADNPNRFDVFFRYKRTGVARIVSTDVEAGF